MLSKSIIAITFMVSAAHLYADDYEKWDLQNREIPDVEYLSYKLSYSGIFTLFAWKHLADTVFYVHPENDNFEGNRSCQFVMELSTENYSVAETFHPVRYQWKSISSSDLKRSYLVEVIDKGKNDSHEATWLDWSNGQLEFYRKREQKNKKKVNYWDEDENFWNEISEVKPVWEKDGKKGVPHFLSHYPKLEGDRSYLIHKRSVDGLDAESIIDPLGMVYLIRQYDFSQGEDLTIDVAVEDEVKRYRAHFLGMDSVTIGSESIATGVVEVMLGGDEGEEEGWIKIWLSNDERRIPVRFQVDATAGKMRIEITEKSYKNSINHSVLGACTVRNPSAMILPADEKSGGMGAQ